jgi:hypothetical protein
MQLDSRQSSTYAFSLPVSEGDATGIHGCFISRVSHAVLHSRPAPAAADQESAQQKRHQAKTVAEALPIDAAARGRRLMLVSSR